MKSTRVNLIIFLLLSGSFRVFPQHAIYEYSNDLCLCRGTFDSTRVTRQQLDNIYAYFWNGPYIEARATVWDPGDVSTLSMDMLEEECGEVLDKLYTVDVPETDYWQDLKETLIKEVEAVCTLKKYTIRAWDDPAILLEYPGLQDTCTFWADALIAGGDRLLEAWKALKEIQKKANADPERVQKEFMSRYTSERQLDWARVEVMTYGWWNCSNHFIPYVETHCGEEFEKLFIRHEYLECDEL